LLESQISNQIDNKPSPSITAERSPIIFLGAYIKFLYQNFNDTKFVLTWTASKDEVGKVQQDLFIAL
jgi:hypothetical protein